MKAHCDKCGKPVDAKMAIERAWDGETFLFCSEECARAGGHLGNEIYSDESDAGAGPLAPGDLDEPSRRGRRTPRQP